MPMNLQDAALSVSVALPAASGTADTAAIDLQVNAGPYVGITTTSDFLAQSEFEVQIPSLTSTQLPNGDTFTFSITQCATLAGSYTTLLTLGTVLTGTGSSVAASTIRTRLPENVQRYIKLHVASGSGTAATAASVTLVPVF